MFWALKEKRSNFDWGHQVKAPTRPCEDTEGNDADVLLPDAGIVVLVSQARHREDVDVTQVGEAGLAGLGIALIGHSGKRNQCYFVRATALVVISLTLISALTLGIVNTLNCSSEAVCKAWSPCKSGSCTRSREATHRVQAARGRARTAPRSQGGRAVCQLHLLACSSHRSRLVLAVRTAIT